MSLCLGQSYRHICINMHTWRGIGILVIFTTIGEKKENSPPPARGTPKRVKEGRSCSSSGEAAKKFQ